MLDTVEKFKIKADIFETDFKRYLDGREDSIDLLNKYVTILCYIITLFFIILGLPIINLIRVCNNEIILHFLKVFFHFL